MPVDSLQACHVVSMRPQGGHDALRRAAAHAGASVIALSPWRLAIQDSEASRTQLRAALEASHVIFTSPAAAHFAARLQPLQSRPEQRWFAIGTGTARALAAAGVDDVTTPERMDSDGLLALPALQAFQGSAVGLVTAPGGRNRIAPTLAQRGARVIRADVYCRVPSHPSTAALARLAALPQRPWLALSSGEALARLLTLVSGDALRVLRSARVVAASPRLVALAHDAGFTTVVVAHSARPRDMIAAMTTPPHRGNAA